MKERISSLLLVFGLCAGMFSACSGSRETKAVKAPDDEYRTFYEVFVYSFYDGNGDGIGDLRGLTEKLDYIEQLGCNGIWLMPIMPSTTYHKYNITDYYGIDPEYGTMEDFEAFMDACKKRNIRVILDMVINHTSSEHPWFVQASDYLKRLGDKEPSEAECPYFTYYNFSKESSEGSCKLEGTDWFYEARFWSGMPDLNLGNERVREEITGIADFWLKKGIDGFRMDAAKEYYSDKVEENIEVLEWFQSMTSQKKANVYNVAEVWTDINTYSKYYQSGINSLFDFAFADSTGIIASTVKGMQPASGFGKALQAIEEKYGAYNANYINAPFYTNHDMGRSAGYYAGENAEEQTKITGAMNLFMSGCAFVYYGEELGMKGAGKDENKRAPMYWSKNQDAEGMCIGPKDMDALKMKYDSLEEQSGDEASIYQYYKKAIRLRNMYPEIARGRTMAVEELSSDILCTVKKSYEGSELIVIMNISDKEQEVQIEKKWSLEETLLTGEEKVERNGSRTVMPAYSIALFRE